MTLTHEEVLAEQMRDPEFRREYEAARPAATLVGALAQLRSDAGLTQEQLAARIGTSATYISRVENRPTNITLKTLARIAGATGTDIVVRFESSERECIEVRIPARSMAKAGTLDRFG